jgi:hypothetical protein
MMGVESWRPSPSGVTTSGMSGSFAKRRYSSMFDIPRRIHSCGRPFQRKYERTLTE